CAVLILNSMPGDSVRAERQPTPGYLPEPRSGPVQEMEKPHEGGIRKARHQDCRQPEGFLDPPRGHAENPPRRPKNCRKRIGQRPNRSNIRCSRPRPKRVLEVGQLRP